MKKLIGMLTLAAAIALTACGPGSSTGTGGGSGGGTGGGAGGGSGVSGDVTADITVNTTWKKDTVYTLKTLIYVTGGATLTIEPGTVIQGDRASALVVARDGKLVAAGTATEPIVFTSSLPAGQRGGPQGDWGGLVLNGKATINVTGGENNAEGLADEPRNKYGGGATPDDTHDCGTLKYVRVEYAGRALSADNELNGITLNACGSATTVDFVQVHRGVDDGIELFGGKVNLKHVVITGSDDDGLDWDQGWTGKAQFVVVQQINGRGNYGIEADSNRTNNDLMPRSAPTLYNVTLVGRNPDTTPSEGPSRGMMLRQGTAGVLANVIVTSFTSNALTVDQAATASQWNSGALKVQNSIFFNNPSVGWQAVTGSMPDNMFDEAMALSDVSLANRDVDPQLTNPMNEAAPSFKPLAGSPALTGGATPPNDGFFDVTATFIGAVGATDWTQGWTTFAAN
ncbi:MAG: hypothetical protein AB1938_23890 [Myxococcota bacterium]